MTLKPSMREKWRYIAFKLERERDDESRFSEADAKDGIARRGALSEGEVKEGIARAVIRFIGELGASKARPKLIEYDAQKRAGIMRCLTEGVGEVRAALALIVDLGGRKCAVRTLKTSGTIRALRGKT